MKAKAKKKCAHLDNAPICKRNSRRLPTKYAPRRRRHSTQQNAARMMNDSWKESSKIKNAAVKQAMVLKLMIDEAAAKDEGSIGVGEER